MSKQTKQEVIEDVCSQVRKILEINALRAADVQIIIRFDGLPIVNAQIRTFAPIRNQEVNHD